MRSIFIFFFVLFVGKITSQTNFSAGVLPKVVTSFKMSPKIKWVNSIESREFFYDKEFELTHSLVDVSTIFSLKTEMNNKLNFGFIFRFKDGEVEYRSLQHYNIIHSLEQFQMGHRFAFEQFYDDVINLRGRYRFTIQRALNGDKIDVFEWYLKLSNEYLWQFNDENLEIRLAPNLGYRLSKRNKIEFGVEYRAADFVRELNKNQLWMRCTMYISL
ncbi:DUF2490 domain-containing protein [uncultured Tenacibaculum sp.]|uniref:DUF2490 domain-containing protein n=1 Tax=uncultured Tenacibaculum sp. TaxID=174713 RepID=UPI00261A3AB1|nr:DUF2490 domain-containing protein [uncultured Tenacibaculum sp.]